MMKIVVTQYEGQQLVYESDDVIGFSVPRDSVTEIVDGVERRRLTTCHLDLKFKEGTAATWEPVPR